MSTLSIAWKDLQILIRDRSNLISTFLLPVAFIIVFLGVAGGGGGEEEDTGEENRIPVSVVNLDEGSEMAGLLLETLNEDGGLLTKSYPQAEAETAAPPQGKNVMNRTRAFRNAVVLLFVQTCVSAGQEACTPGELRSDSTPNSIGIEWDLTGDGDHDAH